MTFTTNNIGHGVLEILMILQKSTWCSNGFSELHGGTQNEHCCSTYDFSSMIANESCIGLKKYTRLFHSRIVRTTYTSKVNV